MPYKSKEEQRAYFTDWRETHKEWKRVYDVARYGANRDERRASRAEFTEWLQILRTNNGCEDCDTHEGWLEHHHVDPETKRFNIALMATCSLDTLEEELEKCVVLCRPCHLKRHAVMRALAAQPKLSEGVL